MKSSQISGKTRNTISKVETIDIDISRMNGSSHSIAGIVISTKFAVRDMTHVLRNLTCCSGLICAQKNKTLIASNLN